MLEFETVYPKLRCEEKGTLPRHILGSRSQVLWGTQSCNTALLEVSSLEIVRSRNQMGATRCGATWSDRV